MLPKNVLHKINDKWTAPVYFNEAADIVDELIKGKRLGATASVVYVHEQIEFIKIWEQKQS